MYYISSNAFLESVEMIIWFPFAFVQSKLGVSPRLSLKDPDGQDQESHEVNSTVSGTMFSF